MVAAGLRRARRHQLASHLRRGHQDALLLRDAREKRGSARDDRARARRPPEAVGIRVVSHADALQVYSVARRDHALAPTLHIDAAAVVRERQATSRRARAPGRAARADDDGTRIGTAVGKRVRVAVAVFGSIQVLIAVACGLDDDDARRGGGNDGVVEGLHPLHRHATSLAAAVAATVGALRLLLDEHDVAGIEVAGRDVDRVGQVVVAVVGRVHDAHPGRVRQAQNA